jgi:hypothetical protein
VSRSMKHVLASAALLLGVSALTGCGPDFDRMSIDGVVTTSVSSGRIDTSRVTIPVGMVLKARVVAYNDDDEVMPTEIRTRNGGTLSISRVISENDWAFYGINEGETDVEVYADDRLVLVMHATVTAQPTP